MAGQSAASRPHTAPIIVGAIIAAALTALAVYFFVLKGKGGENAFDPANNNAYARSDVYVPNKPDVNVTNEPKVKNYNVTLSVECRKNMKANKYDVDILVDGKFLDTLKHGTAKDYNVSLAEGSHKIEFRISGKDINGDDLYQKTDSGSYQIMYLNVSENTDAAYYIEMKWGNDIKVIQK